MLEESDIKLIGQIKKLNGVVAISVFNDERNILLMGDVDIEPRLQGVCWHPPGKYPLWSNGAHLSI